MRDEEFEELAFRTGQMFRDAKTVWALCRLTLPATSAEARRVSDALAVAQAALVDARNQAVFERGWSTDRVKAVFGEPRLVKTAELQGEN